MNERPNQILKNLVEQYVTGEITESQLRDQLEEIIKKRVEGVSKK